MSQHAELKRTSTTAAAAFVIGGALAAQIATMLPVFLLGTMFPLMAVELHLELTTLGQAAAVFFAASACGSAFLASASDRLGPWTVARAALLVTVALCLVLPQVVGPWTLSAAMAVAGLANGTIQPATNVALSQNVAPGRQGLAFGLKQASVPLASLLAGLAVPLLALWIGWRAGFFLAAVLPAMLVFALPSSQVQTKLMRVAKLAPGWSMSTLLWLGAMSGLGAGTANAMAAFLVTATEARGFPLADAALLMALGSGVSIVTRIVLGLIADRWTPPLLPTVALLLAAGSVAYACFALGEGWPYLVLATVLAFGMGWGWAGLSILAIVQANPAAPGRATGVVQSGLFIGAVIGPLLFGHLAHRYGFSTAWGTMALGAGLAALVPAGLAIIGRRVNNDS